MDDEDNIIKAFQELLLKSEARIDKTNDMIFQCVGMVNRICTEYTNQISHLQEARDECLKQNGELLKLVTSLQKEIESYNKHFDTIVAHFMGSTMSGGSENNITVH